MIKKRIWDELFNAVAYCEFLGLFVKKHRKLNKGFEFFSILITVLSLMGWFKFFDKFEHLYTIIQLFLAIVTAMRLGKSHIFISDNELSILQSKANFYAERQRTLENLLYRVHGKKISEKNTQIEFDKLSEEEKLMLKIYKHDKIDNENEQKIYEKAQKNAEQYFSNIKKTFNNE
jgi:hypothetical protein